MNYSRPEDTEAWKGRVKLQSIELKDNEIYRLSRRIVPEFCEKNMFEW